MAGPWLSDEDIKQSLADTAKETSSARLSAYWDNVVKYANRFAVGEIRRAFVDRGLAVADCAKWSDLQEFQRDLALWKASVIGKAHFSDRQSELLAKLDRREELKTCPLLDAGGEIIEPATDSDAAASSGQMAGDLDTFRHPLADYDRTLRTDGNDADPLRGMLTGDL